MVGWALVSPPLHSGRRGGQSAVVWLVATGWFRVRVLPVGPKAFCIVCFSGGAGGGVGVYAVVSEGSGWSVGASVGVVGG